MTLDSAQVQEVLNPRWSRWLVRLLLPCFALLFVGFLPVVWSLATGYTFNWRSLRFETTAVLALDTTPPGASIELNGQRVEPTTPATLDRLRPGQYRVRVSLPGYEAWSRTVTLQGDQARAFTHILLVPQEPLLRQLLDEAVTDFWMESDGTITVRLVEPPVLEQLRGYGPEAFLANPRPPMLQGTNREKRSPDGSALLRWEPDRVWLIGYDKEPWKRWGLSARETVLYRGEGTILNACWHRDSRNVVIVTTTRVLIVAIEDGLARDPVTVKPLLRPLPLSYYDANRRWLFFAEAASVWRRHEYLVKRLELFASKSANGDHRPAARPDR